MRLRFNVDQKAALLKGIDATHSFCIMDIEPEAFTQMEREIVAATMKDGHDCTQGRAQLNEDGSWTNDCYGDRIVLTEPTFDGLQAALREIAMNQTVRTGTRIEERKKELASKRKELVEFLEAPTPHKSEWVHLYDDSTPRWGASSSLDMAQIEVPEEKSFYFFKCITESSDPEDVALTKRMQLHQEQIRAERTRRLEDSIGVLREKRAPRLEQARQLKATDEALLDRLPEIFRQKIEDGYASEKEISESIRLLLCEDAGYPDARILLALDLNELTDNEYKCLREARERAPEGATVEAQTFGQWRQATEEEWDKADKDGEVWEPVTNGFRVEWKVGSYSATADYPFFRAGEVGRPPPSENKKPKRGGIIPGKIKRGAALGSC